MSAGNLYDALRDLIRATLRHQQAKVARKAVEKRLHEVMPDEVPPNAITVDIDEPGKIRPGYRWAHCAHSCL